jgi:hypothetical protein
VFSRGQVTDRLNRNERRLACPDTGDMLTDMPVKDGFSSGFRGGMFDGFADVG